MWDLGGYDLSTDPNVIIFPRLFRSPRVVINEIGFLTVVGLKVCNAPNHAMQAIIASRLDGYAVIKA